jgi:hypothetical protein
VQDSLLVSVFPPDFTTSARDFSKTEKIGIWPQPTLNRDLDLSTTITRWPDWANFGIWVVVSVTRLGEFSPVGRLSALGRFMQIKDLAHILENFFSLRISYVNFFEQKWVGPHFGRLFRTLIWSPWWLFTLGTFL